MPEDSAAEQRSRPKPTTLVIVGDTLHHHDLAGRLCTHSALAAQLDVWARHFDRVRFCGVLGDRPPPLGFQPYAAAHIELVPLRPAGGAGVRAKLGVLRAGCSWIRTLVPELRAADAVHLRTPCNVTAVGLIVSRVLVRRRYALFAGSWHAYPGEPLSYRWQRWLLRWWFAGVVHAYLPPGEEPDRPNLRRGFSPVMDAPTLAEVNRCATATREVTAGLHSGRSLRIVSVGRFSANKNQIVLVEAARLLRGVGTAVDVRFIGDGSEVGRVRQAASRMPGITFEPNASHRAVLDAMSWADLNILPSFREGFPKVLLEGMTVGALPVASRTPMNEAITRGCGWVFDAARPESLASVVEAAMALPDGEWRARRDCGLLYARQHTLNAFADEVGCIVDELWAVPRKGGPAQRDADSRG